MPVPDVVSVQLRLTRSLMPGLIETEESLADLSCPFTLLSGPY